MNRIIRKSFRLLDRKKALQAELRRITGLISKFYRPEKIILFGSLSRGNITEESDIDLLIIKRTNKPYLERIDEINSIAHPRMSGDIFVLTPAEIANEIERNNPYIKEIIEKGTTIYERKS